MNFFRDNEIKHLTVDGTNYVLAAGTTEVNSEAVDAANCSEVNFLILLGTMATSSTIDAKVQGSLNGSDGWTDLEGSAVTQAVAADDDKMIGICVHKPVTYRYLRIAFTRGDGGNSALSGLLAIKTRPREVPVTQAVTAGQFIAQPEFLLSPAAGTA